ncbi:MAG: site-specific integrase [Chitinophagales bacterium]|nr:site-specific integrase [Chitinophagales bacterium]
MPEIETCEDLSTEILIEFFKRLQNRVRKVGTDTFKKGVKNSTVITYRNKLNPFFNWLKQQHLIKENPLDALPLPKLDYNEKKHLSEEQIKILYSTISQYSYNSFLQRRDTAMLSILLYCGLRFNEFRQLEVRDIDFDNQILTVRSTTSKSRKSRFIPIHPTLKFHLKNYLEERKKSNYKTPYLIVSAIKDAGLTIHGVKHWVRTLCEKSGQKFHIHQFRHTFAYLLAKENVNSIKIQKLLGHSSLDMTMTYLRAIDSKNLFDDISKLSY